MFLMESTRFCFRVLGVNRLQGSVALDSRMGTVYGIYPWVDTLVVGNLMGMHFWVGCGCFFLFGAGGGRERVRERQQGRFSLDDTRF